MGLGYRGQKYIWNAINKYGWNNIEHIILENGLAVEDACKKEMELIKLYKTTDEKFGYNLSDGGDIFSPSRRTKEHIENARYGKKKYWKK